jgi:hypothetical protein
MALAVMTMSTITEWMVTALKRRMQTKPTLRTEVENVAFGNQRRPNPSKQAARDDRDDQDDGDNYYGEDDDE